MIKFHEIKVGDIVQVEYEGTRFDGDVIELDHEDKLVRIHNGEQEFWYSPGDLYAIPLDDVQLQKLKFSRELNGDGSIKYLRGPFRILLPGKDHFSSFEIWYREDHRQIHQPIGVHDLQNYYYDMTKVHLTRE
ncbi:MAG: hypothetical protein Q8918_04005 [Bacteroidota bacterium]|nr:hypothetical protein [Bacteroidota bacterium]MDP4211937.1 hypothetical protein [Bacteroidota bacterium]MDP4249258.1 hypothetical protein [Bacteroidota bacterium]